MDIKTIHNLMLPNYLKIVKEIGSKNSKTRARAGWVNTNPLFSAANFAKQSTKFKGGESEGGEGILSRLKILKVNYGRGGRNRT